MMSEQGGIGTTIAPETTPRVEQLMMGEAHCGLPKNQPHSPDVVAAFGKSSQPDSLKLNYITESSSAPPYTHDQIKEVEKNVQKLIDEGKCSGVYLNCLGKNGQSVESAKATIVFLEKLVELVENKGDIAEAISEAKKTINFANIEGFSAVVVGNDGTVQVISEGESAVRVVRGGKVELIGDKLQKDDQLVLCAKSEVEGQDGGRLGEIIKGTKDTKEVIDALIEPPASEKDKLTPVISSLPSREPLDPKKSEDRRIFEHEFIAGVVDGAGGTRDGGVAAEALKQAIDHIAKGEPFQSFTPDGQPTEIKIDRPLSHQGFSREAAELDFNTMIALHLNRIIRNLGGGPDDPQACLAFGEMYQDDKGRLSLTYAIRGDTEIAVIGKDGKVRLVKNHSIRQMAEDGATHSSGIQFDSFGKYLMYREAVGETLGGGAKGTTQRIKADEISVATLDLEEGDRVVYMTDGAAEDMNNFLGEIDSSGKITKERGDDKRMIGMDVLGKVSQDTPDAKNLAKNILEKLDEARKKSAAEGIELPGNPHKRKLVEVDGFKLVVGGKGPTTTQGWDDGETVVCMEAKITKEKVSGQAQGAAAGKAEVVEVAAQAKIDLPVVKVGNSASAGVAMESTVKPAPESPLPVPVPSRDKATVEAVGSKVRIPPYYKDDGEALSYDKARAKLRVKESQLVGKQLESVNVDYMDKATDLIAEAQLLNPGVTITQIMDRLQNPGNYLTKTDAIFTLTGKYTGKYLKHELLILALELKQADGQRAQRLREQFKADDKLGRLHVRTEVQLDAPSAMQHSGALASIYENGKLTPTFETDLHAFTFIADTLMDIPDPSLGFGVDGKPLTYKAKFAELMSSQSPQAQQELLEYRQHFYQQAIKALQTQDLSQTSEAVTEPRKIIQEMRKQITIMKQTLLPMNNAQKAEYIRQHYHGVIGEPSSRTDQNKPEVKGTLEKLVNTFSTVDIDNIFKMSLKGADFMWRRALLDTEKSEKAQETFHIKKLYQGKREEVREQLIQIGNGMRDGTDISSLPPAPPAGPQDDEQSAPIPTVEVPSQIKPPGIIPERSAPRRSEEQEGLPGEKSDKPDKSTPRTGEKRPPGEADTPADKKGLPMSANFGIAAEHDHVAQNIGGGAENYMAIDKAKPNNTLRDKTIGRVFMGIRNIVSHVPLIGKPLGNAIYGSVNAVLHPVQTWRNSIGQGGFRNRATLFSADIDHIVRKKTGFTKGIPVDVTLNVMNAALNGGQKYRSRNIFKRPIIWAGDVLVDVFNIGRNSEQRYAKKWLRDDAEASDIITTVSSKVLSEQDDLGQKYAISREGMTTKEVNANILAQHAGETRFALAEEQPDLQKQAEAHLKAIIANYAGNPNIQDVDLVKQVNEYLLGDFKNALSPGLRDQLDAPEIATNIISLAKTTRQNWAQYQAAGDGGKTNWENFQLNIYLGRSEGMQKRGKVEMDFLTEKLTRRLANKELSAGSRLIGESLGLVNLVKDSLTTFVPYFGGMWIVGAVTGAPMMAGQLLGFSMPGAGAMIGVAALKETGVSLPGLKHWEFDRIGRIKLGHKFTPFRWHGRFEHEVGQVSRESAVGREAGLNSPKRQEIMDRLLVDRKSATEYFIQPIDEMLQKAKTAEFTADDAQKLLGRLAELKARMRLSDLSGSRDLNYHDQNFISYTEGQENHEGLLLASQLLDGLAVLSAYHDTNPNFLPGVAPGDKLFTETGVVYRQQQGGSTMGIFDKISTLAEAQLRFSTDDKKAMEKWFKGTLGFTDPEVTEVMTRLPGINLDIKAKQDLRTKEHALFGMTVRRGVEVAMTSALAMPIAGTVYHQLGVYGQNLYQEGADIAGHISQAGGVAIDLHNFTQSLQDSVNHIGAGVSHYGQEWGEVIAGRPVVAIDPITNNLISGVSPLQRGVLTIHGFVDGVIQPPHWPFGHITLARQNIDDVAVDLPREFQNADVLVNGQTHNVLHNTVTGEVYDLTNKTLTHIDNPAGGHTLMVVDDRTGVAQDASTFFNNPKIQISESSIPGAPVIQDIWKPDALTRVDNTTGHDVTIPANSKFIQDINSATGLPTGKWDLVAVDNGGNVVHTALPLLDNVEYAPDGSMIHNAVGSTATISPNAQVIPGVHFAVPAVAAAPMQIMTPDGGIDPAGVWGQHVTHVTRDGWDPTNRLQFYNHKEGDAVILDISKVASVHGHGGESGVFVTFPGHPNEGFFLGGDLHKIEPGSTQVIPGTNGMTYGEFYTFINRNALKTFEHASELTQHRDVFDVHALEAAEKFIDAAGNVHIKVGATILGSGKMPEIPTLEIPPSGIDHPGMTLHNINIDAPPITETVTTPVFAIQTIWPRPELYYLPFVVRSPVERSVSRAEGKIFKDEEEKKRLAKEEAKKAKEAEKKAKEEEKRKAKEVKKDKTAKKLEEADQIIGADKKTEKKDESGESTKPYVPTEEEKAEAKKEADEQNKQTFLQNRNAMIMRINNDQKDLKPEIFAERYKRPAAEFEGKPEAVAKFATEMTLNLLYKNVYQAEDYYHALESQYTPDQKALTTKTNQVSQALGSNKTYMEKVEEISELTESDAKYASLKQELEKLEKAALEKVGLNNINTYEDLMKKIDEMHKQISETDGFKNKLRELSEATLARLRQQVDVWVAEAAAAKAAEAKPVGAAKPAAAVVAKVT